MSEALPSNEECFRRIVGRGDLDARCCFQRLLAYAKQHGHLEQNFEGNLLTRFHECFWELYLPAALERFGIRLKRGSAREREPDFFFSNGNVTVFVEAVACGEPTERNQVPLQADADQTDFEASGLAPDERIMQRLATCVEAKILAVNRPDAQTSMGKNGHPYWVVLALNGRRAITDWPHEAAGVPFAPFIVKTLFGLPWETIDQNQQSHWLSACRLSFPIGHFAQPTWSAKQAAASSDCDVRHIAGVLYSATGVWDTAQELGDDFLFVQNPHGPDATQLFSFCKRGIWVRRQNSSGQFYPARL